MKFTYGKKDWKTLERGEETGFLMSNGLGGFSSQTAVGSCARNDHAVLMACTHAPNHRIQMIHRLEETVQLGEKSLPLSSQRFQGGKEERGFQYLSGFQFEDYPIWTYQFSGVEIKKSMVLAQGSNTLGLRYEIQNRSLASLTLTVKPWLQFVKKGERLSPEQIFEVKCEESTAPDRRIAADQDSQESKILEVLGKQLQENVQAHTCTVTSNGLTLHLKTTGTCRQIPKEFCDKLYYEADVSDGKMSLGRSAANHIVQIQAKPGVQTTLELVYGMEESLPDFADIKRSVQEYRQSLRTQAGFTDPLADQLAVSANQFISERVSTGKQTILAGFPFFEDWGRDTMIALPGCCLATGQYATAKGILETFLQYCRDGLMPNLFPEGTEKPWYNTVDAALLFILTLYQYEQKTQDLTFVREAYPKMQEILECYQRGTHFGIHMDEDGLICAGQGYDQVTWMDVRVENILPTPRHGKPVEINAYWYNALRIMELWQEKLEIAPEDRRDYGALAEKVQRSFREKFWNEEKQCLRDVLCGTKAENQIRCNQIWVVAQPFSLLPEEQERQVVETVFRHLYTPYGLRTLSPEDPEFHPFYGGAQLDRDLAYHQGTVWPFPLGAYYLAYLKVQGYSEAAKEEVREQLSLLEPALWEGCAGQLPEIYDGENPASSKGCFAQAWSVGEILRVYDELR